MILLYDSTIKVTYAILDPKMERIKSLSVFFPAYNEEGNIARTINRAMAILPQIAREWEIIVINDGSTDKTGQIVNCLIKKEPRIKMIVHTPNRGYGAALKSGFYSARYQWIAFTDSDGQFDFDQIRRFLPLAEKADAIFGFREKRGDSFYRNLLQKVLSLVNRLLFGLKVRDVDCGFKMIKKEVIEKIPHLITESAITETELVVRIKRAGFKIAEVGVSHLPRKKGKQTGGNFKIIFKAGIEGLKLWGRMLQKEKE
ncbi:MAG: glycosyltransferase family 2 protein [Candidatus Pacebacteria bacterium]|nr:glycosyltransferase family 2 protein [Candidatus Paceibacterota bacterium]